jgi:hypothetical protein
MKGIDIIEAVVKAEKEGKAIWMPFPNRPHRILNVRAKDVIDAFINELGEETGFYASFNSKGWLDIYQCPTAVECKTGKAA